VAIGEQMLIFQNEKLIKKADLMGMTINDTGGISFDVFLYPDPEVFKSFSSQ